MATHRPRVRAIPVNSGGVIWVPVGCRLRSCVEALRRMGYLLMQDQRGRLVATRLH